MANPITVYIVRHGLAGEHGSYANDNERPLTVEGKQKTRQVALRLAAFNLKFDLILTSPLVRARETAEILMDVGLGKQLEEFGPLAPGGSIGDWLTWLSGWEPGKNNCMALVGHEPDLSTWAEMLIWGEAKGAINLKKAGVIGLLLPVAGSPVGHSQLFWLTPPRFLVE
jgi:phosphohistidine phosphatase